MIQVIENGDSVKIPDEIAKLCGSDAPAYLIINPEEGNITSRAEVEQQIRNNYKKGACIIFNGRYKLPDGRIVSVGQKIDPIIAHMMP